MAVSEHNVVPVLQVERSCLWRRRSHGQEDGHAADVTGRARLPVVKVMATRDLTENKSVIPIQILITNFANNSIMINLKRDLQFFPEAISPEIT